MKSKNEKIQEFKYYIEKMASKLESISDSSRRTAAKLRKKAIKVEAIIEKNKKYTIVEEGAMLFCSDGSELFVFKYEDPNIVGGNYSPLQTVSPEWCFKSKVYKIGSTFKVYRGRPGEGEYISVVVESIC